MSGLRRDDNTRSATGYHVAEPLENKCRAIEIDLQDRLRRRLRRRNTSGMDDAGEAIEGQV